MFNNIKLMFSPNWRLTSVLVFLAILLTIRLGIWQLDRLDQEESFNSHLLLMQAMPELNLSENLDGVDLMDMEYRPATASGYFDFDNQVVIRNQVWVQSWGDEIGYVLLTPLRMKNGESLMVHRGWIPLTNDTPESWRTFDQPGEVSLQGITRLPLEKGEMGGGVPDPTLIPGQDGLSHWNYVNINRIQLQLPYKVLPIYLQQQPVANQETLPYKNISSLELMNGSHLGYAMQWFFYSLMLVFGYPLFIGKHQES